LESSESALAALSRAALGAFLRASREMREHGTVLQRSLQLSGSQRHVHGVMRATK